jgi:hypothetical protein
MLITWGPNLIANGRFEATETKIQARGVVRKWPRKSVRTRISMFRQFFNLWSARISKSKQACDFIESFTNGIIDSAPESLEGNWTMQLKERGMPSTGYKSDRRVSQFFAEC